MFKQISIIANTISLITIAFLFYSSWGMSCFNLNEWYLYITPVFLATLSEFISIFITEEDEANSSEKEKLEEEEKII